MTTQELAELAVTVDPIPSDGQWNVHLNMLIYHKSDGSHCDDARVLLNWFSDKLLAESYRGQLVRALENLLRINVISQAKDGTLVKKTFTREELGVSANPSRRRVQQEPNDGH